MPTTQGRPSGAGATSTRSPPRLTRQAGLGAAWRSSSAARSAAYSLPKPPKSSSMPAGQGEMRAPPGQPLPADQGQQRGDLLRGSARGRCRRSARPAAARPRSRRRRRRRCRWQRAAKSRRSAVSASTSNGSTRGGVQPPEHRVVAIARELGLDATDLGAPRSPSGAGSSASVAAFDQHFAGAGHGVEAADAMASGQLDPGSAGSRRDASSEVAPNLHHHGLDARKEVQAGQRVRRTARLRGRSAGSTRA